MILAVYFQRTRLTRVLDESNRTIQALRRFVMRRNRQLHLFHHRARVAQNGLHERQRHSRAASGRAHVHAHQHALVPLFRTLRHHQTGDTGQIAFVV